MRRVLLVEDETLVALLLEDMLDDLGFEVVEVASQLETALDLVERVAFDVAVLDVNLGGYIRSFPVADRLRLRGIPFIFATGHERSGLAIAYPGTPVVQKPFRRDELSEALQRALAKNRS
ncbi:response regulator [Geminicoccus roseus]|uniref:response regulator n=1 Tax=Geminicoccus roseus TaxID=404900 RepID=UPI0004211272|nr:response regulator [Geminicoccus roseus]